MKSSDYYKTSIIEKPKRKVINRRSEADIINKAYSQQVGFIAAH